MKKHVLAKRKNVHKLAKQEFAIESLSQNDDP